MQFVQFGMLGALGALAIPVVIHLLFRNRPKRVDLGTLQFLHAVLREDARKRKVKRWLLLTLRLACVALVALLFARPYLLATVSGVGDRLLVVLIDRSSSAGLKGNPEPLAKAVALAKAVVAQAGPKTQIEAATFDREVRPLKDPAAALREGLAPATGTGTDYAAAMAWARDVCVRSRRPVRELHVFTDLQRSGLDRGESVSLPPDVAVHLVDVGRAFPKNVAVTGLSVSPTSPRPGGAAVVTARILNASPLPLSAVPARLHLESGGAERDLEKTVDLDGGATATVVFELKDLSEGVWRGHVEAAVDGDALPFDDRRFVALAVAPPAPVLLLDGDPGANGVGGETYFLRVALRLAPEGERYEKTPFDPRAIDASGTSGGVVPDPGKAAAVVLANVGGLDAADAGRLAGFVERGGGLVVFAGDRFGPAAAKTLAGAGLGVGEVIETVSAADLPWRLDRWEASHPVFRPFANPEHGDLRRPAFSRISRIRPSDSARVLATFRGGDPALVESSFGKGKILWFASSCDRDWGDWPRGRLYVPLVHQMVAYASGLADGGPVRRLTAADGLPPGVTESGGVIRVVNADPFESDTARTTPKEFARRFGFTPPGPVARQDGETAGVIKTAKPDDRLRPDEVWPWFALTLLGLLMLEQFLANRTSA